MGNQESKPEASHKSGSSQSSSHANTSHTQHGSIHERRGERRSTNTRRRQSVNTIPAIGTSSTSHAATLTSAIATTANSSKRSAEETLKKATQPQAQPPPASHTPSQAVNTALQTSDANASPEEMGNSASKDGAKTAAANKARVPTTDPTGRASPLPRAINVPASGHPSAPANRENASPPIANNSPFADASYPPPLATPSQFSRPPRLPLPIGEEVHAPGSPILSPEDISDTIAPLDEIQLSRRASVLSGTTADDDDLGDDVSSLEPWGGAPTVPTLLEWREAGEKVYVTGTFAGWDKKFRLHRNGPSKHPGALSAYINLAPGTHHVRFIVDNDSKLSKNMPTAVDYNNFLVNYIEVAPPQPSTELKDGVAAVPSRPTTATSSPPQMVASQVPASVHPPQAIPQAPTPVQQSIKLAGDATPRITPQPIKDATSTDTLASQIVQTKTAPLAVGPTKRYHQEIPQFLLDIEAEDDKNVYPRAAALISTLPEPPSLPMFLGKSVLNGATPMKDDASVLVMPNHTVLNHLATSSIKNKVLATSATTRYKKKFLTTIMYKPTTTE